MDHEIGLFLSQVNCPEKLNICAPGKVPLSLLGLDGNRLGVKILLPIETQVKNTQENLLPRESGVENTQENLTRFFSDGSGE